MIAKPAIAWSAEPARIILTGAHRHRRALGRQWAVREELDHDSFVGTQVDLASNGFVSSIQERRLKQSSVPARRWKADCRWLTTEIERDQHAFGLTLADIKQ